MMISMAVTRATTSPVVGDSTGTASTDRGRLQRTAPPPDATYAEAVDASRNQVAVVETAGAYRRGLANALAEAGYEAVEPQDLASWANETAALAALIGGPADDLDRTIAVVAPAVTVVALVAIDDPEAWWRAMVAGASAVADRDERPEAIVTVLGHAMEASVLMPSSAVRWLMDRAAIPTATTAQVSREEAEWLRFLADGRTVADLADEVGFSERTMFRRLYEIYGRIGARNRIEAVVAAQRLRLIDDVPPTGAGTSPTANA